MKWFTRPKKVLFDSVEAVVADIKSKWNSDDLAFVASGEYDFGMIGRRIRNEYELWSSTNPLTQHWVEHPEDRDIQGGIDYSADHPDNISGVILAALRKSLLEES